DAAEWRRINCDSHTSQTFSCQLLGDKTTEGMANNDGLRLELANRISVVICNLLDTLVSKDLRVLVCLLNGIRIIGPDRCERYIALLFEECTPAIPTIRKEPQAVYKHDWLQS